MKHIINLGNHACWAVSLVDLVQLLLGEDSLNFAIGAASVNVNVVTL